MTTMYDKLLQLSLFQGLTLKDFTSILSKVKFRFEKYQAGDTIIREGDDCKRVAFLLDGEIMKKTVTSGEHPMEVNEWFTAPLTFELSSLFGLQTTYRSTYIACTDASVMWMHKRFLVEELNIYPIVDMNYRNIMSAQVQRMNDYLWSAPPSTDKGYAARFFLQRMEQMQGKKVFRALRADLAAHMNVSFNKVSVVLPELQKEGVLTYDRGVITIPEAARLKELAE
ncbi:MAG: Crp/Fnr family transcriptional regulator [Bacteroidaceae bacterium]|nr:Crp/Fnr family transcriptional regulator [Bacteroidaceae bacterium]MBQ9884657.1 Crp/Fnr family transcriptional regulator [Bacteroidaceae bacterium]